jgi:hypothetical protein
MHGVESFKIISSVYKNFSTFSSEERSILCIVLGTFTTKQKALVNFAGSIHPRDRFE